MGADKPGLKPIDTAALQANVEKLAKELMPLGAMVLLTTEQGNVVFGYGTTELGTANLPRADIHFRAASNTKTMTAAVKYARVFGERRSDRPTTPAGVALIRERPCSARPLLMVAVKGQFSGVPVRSLIRFRGRAQSPRHRRSTMHRGRRLRC
jgi:hypothetical protein